MAFFVLPFAGLGILFLCFFPPVGSGVCAGPGLDDDAIAWAGGSQRCPYTSRDREKRTAPLVHD